jgi:hypothetical protein
MFSSQLFGMTSNSSPALVTAQEEPAVEDVEMSTCRYPKRKRGAVSYIDDRSDFELSADEDEEDFRPQKKVLNFD